MENLVAHQLVDGQWQARTVTREGLMAQQREFDQTVPTASRRPPAYGLLTRTLVHSPVVKQILPAQIRDPLLNDVVFVGETFIELHILKKSGKLRRVGAKTDFAGNIRHARVFGAPRQLQHYSQHEQAADGGAVHDGSMELDRDDLKSPLPPHILALTLDTGHLAFVYARDAGPQRDVEFVISARKIGLRGPRVTHLGRTIAVDSRSRALAIAAWEGSFRMFSLHTMEEMERQARNGEPLNPIKEEKTFQVRGTILHMLYLYPPQEDQEHVMLLLFLVDEKKKFRLQLYEWWSSRPLQTAAQHGRHGLRAPEDMHFPLHVIPLVICSAFLVVTEHQTHVVKASDIQSGNAIFAKVSLPTTGSKQHSLVTAWARAPRMPKYALENDDMYIALENGDIYFVEVAAQGFNVVQTATKAAHLDCAPGTAFACLDTGFTSRDDMLITGGEGSDGGIFLSRHFAMVNKSGDASGDSVFTPELEQAVTNGAPVIDFQLVKLPVHGNTSGVADRDRVYTCTGRGEHGAVTEFRYGLEARIQEYSEYLQGVKRLFVLPDASGRGYFVLSSLADESQLLFLRPSNEDWSGANEGSSLELGEVTLAAQAFDRYTVQVTPSSIVVTELRYEDIEHDGDMDDVDMNNLDGAGPRLSLQRRCDVGETIVAAAIWIDGLSQPSHCYIVLAVRNGASVRLQLGSISPDHPDGQFLSMYGQPNKLNDDPTLVSIIELNGRMATVVGTRDATIRLFEFNVVHGLLPGWEVSMAPTSTEELVDLYVCESAVLLVSEFGTKLLCGLRGGMVIVIEVTVGAVLKLDRSREIKLGPIPVQIFSDVRSKDTAFVLAGPELYRFHMPRTELKVSQIVFQNITGTAYSASWPGHNSQSPGTPRRTEDGSKPFEASVQAFAQINTLPDPENIIICATSDHLFCADVGESEKVCARRLRLGETPKRLLYYEPLKVFVVACSKIKFDENPRNAVGIGKKASFASLRFIDPRTGESRAERDIKDSSKQDTIFGRGNEVIHCISEWTAKHEGKVYRYIVVGTGYINLTASENKKGRLVVITITGNASSGKIDVRRRFQIAHEGPVLAVCPYEDRSLVYCAGKTLYFKTLDLETKKLDAVTDKKLRSEGIRISVSAPHIYVTRSKDSLLVLKFDRDQLHDLYNDEQPRNGFDHIQLLPDFFLVTDKGKGAAGLWQPPDRRNTESLSVVVESDFTSSICRLRRGRCRPPWNDGRTRPGVVNSDENILAASTSGAFFHLTLLTADALRLLRDIQTLYEGTASARRFRILGLAGLEEDGDIGSTNPAEAHVDGDKLAAVVSRGSAWLETAIQGLEQGQAEAGAFVALARSLLGVQAPDVDIFEALIAYIANLVEDAVL